MKTHHKEEETACPAVSWNRDNKTFKTEMEDQGSKKAKICKSQKKGQTRESYKEFVVVKKKRIIRNLSMLDNNPCSTLPTQLHIAALLEVLNEGP